MALAAAVRLKLETNRLCRMKNRSARFPCEHMIFGPFKKKICCLYFLYLIFFSSFINFYIRVRLNTARSNIYIYIYNHFKKYEFNKKISGPGTGIFFQIPQVSVLARILTIN